MFLEACIATCNACGGNGVEIPGSGFNKPPYPVVTYRCDRCGRLSNDPPNGSSFTYRHKTLFLQSIHPLPLLLEWLRGGA